MVLQYNRCSLTSSIVKELYRQQIHGDLKNKVHSIQIVPESRGNPQFFALLSPRKGPGKLDRLCLLLNIEATIFLFAEYDKKKYVWKLLYIYMLGYDVEFGHKQAADLIPASK